MAVAVLALAPGLLGASCQKRVAVDHFPPGALQVGYVAAANYTDCLVASVVMCANYVRGSEWCSAARLRSELTAAGKDPALTGDMRSWLAGRNITMIALRGELSDAQPTGLGWWVRQRGYPVTCVVNRHAGKADYNHAVVVIGIDARGATADAEAVYVLDPASPKRLERWDRLSFEHYWGSGGSVMLPLFETPGRGTPAMPTGARS